VVLKLCRKHGTYLGRCTSCKVEDNQRRHRKEQAQGRRTLHWQKVRRDALARDGWVCRLKVDDDCTVRATTVHLDPKLKGKHQLAEVGGVVSACLHCHGVVDGRTTPHGGRGVVENSYELPWPLLAIREKHSAPSSPKNRLGWFRGLQALMRLFTRAGTEA
jgi:hypothetical protein